MMTDDTMTLLLDQIQASSDGDFLGSSFFCVHPLGLSEWG